MMRVACIGAGDVGRAWAVVFARAGYEVALYDVQNKLVEEHAKPMGRRTLIQLHEAGFLKEEPEIVSARIRSEDTVEGAVFDAIWVQESVREDISIKRDVFKQIAQSAPADALLASSTSAILGSDFLGHIDYPERALVAHPVNPPSLIPLVELCGSRWTSDSTMIRARSILENAEMRPITLNKEIEGFILNRLQYTLVAEAMHLVGEGYCSAEDIDMVMTDGLALRWASMGPFQAVHLNASQGFRGFVDQLGSMMRHMGKSAMTAYEWPDSLADEIHASLIKETPISQLADRQIWRDERILKTRKLQASD